MYRNALLELSAWLNAKDIERLQDVTARDLDRFRGHLSGRGLAAASVAVKMRAVRGLFRHLQQRQLLLLNPAETLRPVRMRRRLMPVPSEEEVRRVLEACDVSTPLGVRNRALLETAYGTGARIRELWRLRPRDLDLDGQTVRLLGKGERERVVPLGAQAARWVGRYLNEARPALLRERSCEALWIGAGGRPMGYHGLRLAFKVHSRAEGIRTPITPHALRRACATQMLRNGAHPVQIQMLLGHADLRNLSQYLKVTITEMRAAHERSGPGS